VPRNDGGQRPAEANDKHASKDNSVFIFCKIAAKIIKTAKARFLISVFLPIFAAKNIIQ
jgi:hypothetical protein